MKIFIFLLFFLILTECSNTKKVYWCGDHPCINKKEKEAYFKKTMIIEVRELSKKDKKKYTDFEKIKQQVSTDAKKRFKKEKDLAKQTHLEEKKRIKEEKQLAKQIRLEEKRRIKEEKQLAKQIRLEEKRRIKEEKQLAKQIRLDEKSLPAKKKQSAKNLPSENEIIVNVGVSSINDSDFKKLVEKITKRNMYRSYPDINDIPN